MTARAVTPANAQAAEGRAVAISPPRLPYHPAIGERFGIDQAGWRALTDAVWPQAKSPDSVILALSYCRARKLDPFKRPIHIVPMWDRDRRCMVETIWPGIAELRTTAFRTGQYAGRDPGIYGPDVTRHVGSVEMTFPEWCQITVYRMLGGQRVPFPGPRVYWLETYASAKRDDPTPNDMWRKRPRGQHDKCAEAAALRAAFPEEIGADYAAEEMEGRSIVGGAVGGVPIPEPRAALTADGALAQLESFAGTGPAAGMVDEDTGEIMDGGPETDPETVGDVLDSLPPTDKDKEIALLALTRQAEAAADKGFNALGAWWGKLTPEQRNLIGHLSQEMNARATRADDAAMGVQGSKPVGDALDDPAVSGKAPTSVRGWVDYANRMCRHLGGAVSLDDLAAKYAAPCMAHVPAMEEAAPSCWDKIQQARADRSAELTGGA